MSLHVCTQSQVSEARPGVPGWSLDEQQPQILRLATLAQNDSAWGGFVVSHPFAKKPAKGWGTRACRELQRVSRLARPESRVLLLERLAREVIERKREQQEGYNRPARVIEESVREAEDVAFAYGGLVAFERHT